MFNDFLALFFDFRVFTSLLHAFGFLHLPFVICFRVFVCANLMINIPNKLIIVLFIQNMSSQGHKDYLPPPPPIVPPNVKPMKIEQELAKKKLPTKTPMARRGLGTKGTKLPLLTNHFEVNVANTDGFFFQYSVCFVFHDSVVFLLTFVY
jgi:hypothetical protein